MLYEHKRDFKFCRELSSCLYIKYEKECLTHSMFYCVWKTPLQLFNLLIIIEIICPKGKKIWTQRQKWITYNCAKYFSSQPSAQICASLFDEGTYDHSLANSLLID